jgi:hypothetical protein
MLLTKFLLHFFFLCMCMFDAHLICIWIYWFVVYTIAFLCIHVLIKNLGGITRGICHLVCADKCY